ncbi:MAG TPA: DNA ligase D [Acidobacteriota bacterium]|nr:DNA ligase D [Acidobacteriota bacterium]
MALKTYHEKRNFERTPEPKGTERKKAGYSFVVQKHAATRLHYDFRLELDGVLKSWAVPKGPSYDTREKRLAVHVEDHPVDYGSFEGIIPEGEYGGGTVMIWDRGNWIPLDKDPVESYRKGVMKFRLEGQKLRGAWTLVRMKPRPGEEDKKENWLLIKERDEFTRPLSEFDVEKEFPNSVVSGRSMEEIAKAQDDVWHSELTDLSEELKKLSGARQTDLPDFIQPQLATLVEQVPKSGKWFFEIKLDGYRELCRIDNREVRFISRTGKNWTDKFASLIGQVRQLPVETALLDGEVVVLKPDGTTSFQALQNALSGDHQARLTYYVFDVLYLDGFDLRNVPLADRKMVLERLLEHLPPGSAVRILDHFEGSGDVFFREACRHALEGIVCKRADRPYLSGRGRDWLKVKCLKKQEFVVVGFTDPAGGRKGLGALLLAVNDEDQGLVFAGKVGTGFTERSLRDLRKRLDSLEVDKPAVSNPPKGAALKGVHWVQPKLVAEVAFSEWTEDGQLRHPSFQGLREDKDPSEVRREQAGKAVENTDSSSIGAKSAGEKHPTESKDKPAKKTKFAGVTLTHPDRLLYPESGIKKRDVAEYYEAVSDRILPHLKDRPLTLIRCPDTWADDCFYQKHLDKKSRAPVIPVPIVEDGEEKHYMAINSLRGLMHFVQMGVLEFHPWGARIDNLDRPDRMIFDLDPDPSLSWEKTTELAHLVRELLNMLGLRSFAKTTGGKGLHVVVPLERRHSWDEVKQFSKAVVDHLVGLQPKIYTAKVAKAGREGKIYLDYLRNNKGSHAVAAYSTRAKSGAPVSVPISWDEVSSGVRSDAFNLKNVIERLQNLREDPWKDFEKTRQSITEDMKRRLKNKK